jgi:hypothetical protein
MGFVQGFASGLGEGLHGVSMGLGKLCTGFA